MNTHQTQLDPRLEPGAKEQQVRWSPTCSSVPRQATANPARTCMNCGAPARLYPCGWRCGKHAPGATGATSETERVALRMAAAGLPVFMLSRSKVPVARCEDCKQAEVRGLEHDKEACPHLLCHGFYAATTDPDRVRAMVRAVPTGMLAMRTGAASGIVVVDIDPGHGGRIDHTIMTPTRTAVTGSGGYHLWYRHPGEPIPCSQSRVGDGVDIRGDGGYAVVPPARHPRTGRPYEWVKPTLAVDEMAPALVAACLPAPVPTTTNRATRRAMRTKQAAGITNPDALLASLLESVRRAPEGKRRTTLYGAARGIARMVTAGALTSADAETVLIQAGLEAGQEERKIRAAFVGGFRDEGVQL